MSNRAEMKYSNVRRLGMNIVRASALSLLLVTPALPAAAADPAPATRSAGLTRLLEAELSRFPSKSGIYVKQLATGEEAAVNPDMHFDSASTIKVAIMVLAYRLADQKKLDLNERYEIKASDYRSGSGIFQFNDVGLKPTLRDIITQMIITSDNSATDIMIAQVGGIGAVNDFLRQSGYSALKLNKTTLDYFRFLYGLVDPKFGSLPAEDLYAVMSRAPAFTRSRQALIEEANRATATRNMTDLVKKQSADEGGWLGIMTPRESARMLEAIELGTIASKEACDEMKRILRGQQAGALKIPHHLSMPVGHKTGESFGVTNDIAIVYASSGPIVITSYNMEVVGSRSDADDRIGAVARLVAEYFDGARAR